VEKKNGIARQATGQNGIKRRLKDAIYMPND